MTISNYQFYSSILFSFFILATILYFTRNRWLPRLPTGPTWYSRIPNPSNFLSDAASGLHSTNFDLASNIEGGDVRAGLDEQGKREVQRIMKKKRVGFDEARRLVMLERFKREGVGEDGRPRDPRFVSFS